MMSLLVLFACGGLSTFGDEEGLNATATSEDVVMTDDALLLDDLPGVEAIQVEDDRLILTVTTDTPVVEPGSVAVGRRGGGYLRRVESVELDADTMVLHTSTAKLTDVVERGRVDALLQLDPNRSERIFDLGGRVLLDHQVWSDLQGDYVNVRVETSEDSQASWNPEIDYDIDIDFTSIDASFDSTFQFDYRTDFVATIDGAYATDESVHILTETFPFQFMMGEVPVWGEATVALYADLELLAEVDVEATLHTEAHATVHANAAFYDAWGPNNRRWETGIGGGIEPGENGFVWTSAEADGFAWAKVGVRAEVGLELYGAAGAVVTLEPEIEAETCDDPTAFAVDAGITGTHRYYFEALGWSLYDSEPMPFGFGPWTILECPTEG